MVSILSNTRAGRILRRDLTGPSGRASTYRHLSAPSGTRQWHAGQITWLQGQFPGQSTMALVALEPDPERRQGRLFPNGNDWRGSQVRTAFEAILTRAGITCFRF